MQPQKTVVVADDHPIVISGMRLLLSGSRFFQVVGEARNGTEAILRCEQFPDRRGRSRPRHRRAGFPRLPAGLTSVSGGVLAGSLRGLVACSKA